MPKEIKGIEDWDTTGISEQLSEQLSEELKQKLAEIVAGIVLNYQKKWKEELAKKIELIEESDVVIDESGKRIIDKLLSKKKILELLK